MPWPPEASSLVAFGRRRPMSASASLSACFAGRGPLLRSSQPTSVENFVWPDRAELPVRLNHFRRCCHLETFGDRGPYHQTEKRASAQVASLAARQNRSLAMVSPRFLPAVFRAWTGWPAARL